MKMQRASITEKLRIRGPLQAVSLGLISHLAPSESEDLPGFLSGQDSPPLRGRGDR